MSAALPAERFLQPQWPAPASVRALCTLRAAGSAPFDTLDLAPHAALPAAPCWLQQVHGVQVMDLDRDVRHGTADAAFTRRRGVICAIQTADCLPVLLAARDGRIVAAAHAGWRGLAAGVLEATIASLQVPPQELLAWLGPAISAPHFEVREQVLHAFVDADSRAHAAFTPNERGRWQCDLYALARRRLVTAGVNEIYGGGLCTWDDPARFFSYRRDGGTGRMASLIWIDTGAQQDGMR